MPVSVPGGESLRDVQRRMVELVDELLDDRPDASLVLVTHMIPIKSMLSAALGGDFRSGRRMVLDPATVTVVDWSLRPVSRLFNPHAHLVWSNARWLAASCERVARDAQGARWSPRGR